MKNSLFAAAAFFAVTILTSKSNAAGTNTKACLSSEKKSAMTFCLGEAVFKLGSLDTGSRVNGPYNLIYITDAYSEAYVQTKSGVIESSLPSMDLAVMRGCNDYGVCIGDRVLWSLNGHVQISKVAGLFTGRDIVIELGNPKLGEAYYQLVTADDYKKMK